MTIISEPTTSIRSYIYIYIYIGSEGKTSISVVFTSIGTNTFPLPLEGPQGPDSHACRIIPLDRQLSKQKVVAPATTFSIERYSIQRIDRHHMCRASPDGTNNHSKMGNKERSGSKP